MLPPLVFVVILSMIKDAYEDYKRHKEDSNENNSKTQVYDRNSKRFETMEWRQIQIGDVVKVNDNGFFPADMIVLHTTEPEGAFYVETKNLDGETNLKLKNVSHDLIEPFASES